MGSPSLYEEIHSIREDMSKVLGRVTTIETLVSTEAARCPYRETIAKAANNKTRLDNLERDVTTMRIQVARIGALYGGLSGIGGAIITAVVMRGLGL
jgi:hypothetical protein